MSELPKAYNPGEVETEIYQKWLDSGAFKPSGDKTARPFTIMMPPPNVTGSLHMGHALNNTIQDILVRYHRMLGDNVLWVPGTDHAGIATQNVVEKRLKKQGKTRHDLGRKKFIEEVWKWKDEYGNLILEQLKKLGCSCDWSRQRFTLDEKYNNAVNETFVHYYKKGYIYKGPRVVNWCPRCHTAISDIEIKYKDRKTTFYTFKYSKDFPITIATSRPETKIADTAIAVNPKDERYKDMIGKTYEVDFIGFNLKLKVIADHNVDMEFGTGALGVTPAHSMIDFEMAKQNDLEIISIIDEDGKMNKNAGQFAGLKADEAQEKVVEKIRQAGLMVKEEEYEQPLSLCDRCDSAIEPLISKQWFVDMKELAKPAIEVVKDDKINFYPDRWKKIYLDWMENIRDWCISRQLWWGHQIPVYYCNDCDTKHDNPIVAKNKPAICPKCDSENIVQDKDVLDTWFSSALWPFATLGWPEQTDDLKDFYPTTFLSTAPDIIYLWVARMIFSGLEFMDQIPFDTVYLHSTILAKDGSRMSKSRPETIVDPLKMIDKYGADATRFGIIYQTSRDLQAIKFSEEDLLAGKKFINKLWNMARFIGMMEENDGLNGQLEPQTLADQWILDRLNSTIQDAESLINEYELGKAAHVLYDFAWKDFADWYIEISKNEKNLVLVKFIYQNILKLLHPFIPFASEEIYKVFESGKMLINSDWPKSNEIWQNKQVAKDFVKIQDLITGIRNAKKDAGFDPFQKVAIEIKTPDNELFDQQKNIIAQIGKLTSVKISNGDKLNIKIAK